MSATLSFIDPRISEAYRLDESICVKALLQEALFSEDQISRVSVLARDLARNVRLTRLKRLGFDTFLRIYGDLSSKKGVSLMCLAETLLRTPDHTTQNRLIKEKLNIKDWMAPIIRPVVVKAMQVLGKQFVIGENIASALKTAKSKEAVGYCYSYDMLGEAAKTAKDAERYLQSYQMAIIEIAKVSQGLGPFKSPGISVKLSALHPRYEWIKRDQMLTVLYPILKGLALQAKTANIGFTIDAEEADRLELSLLLIQRLVLDPDLEGWQGFGFAVQAYQKRASVVIDWIIELARKHKRFVMIRLVKGAYWDSEIKCSQERGLMDYPVFTRKSSTDLSYLVCAKKLLAARDVIYPQFATHNAYSVAAILVLAANDKTGFEFQCLQGMGDSLYNNIVGEQSKNGRCRIYAPVGGHENLLGYLVRRLLENGANSSFVNQILDPKMSLEDLIADPVAKTRALFKVDPEDNKVMHPKIALPAHLYGRVRPNSKGLDVTHDLEINPVLAKMNAVLPTLFNNSLPPVTPEEIESTLARAALAASVWVETTIETRAACLERTAHLLEQHQPELMTLLIREGGKTVQDSASEIREAIDFCWYYREQVRESFEPIVLPGPTGEHNQIALYGRGVIACISPWNFPLAIFLGQIIAALAAGNVVIAKPATQTPFIAAKAIDLLHQAGFPTDVVQCVIGSGRDVGDFLVRDLRIQGVMFTGSTSTARHINQQLSARLGPIIPFIAETGGQNCMIVDSSALPEAVVTDVILSAFNSAGQRCSALRVLFLQAETASRILEMLQGAMQELTIGDPINLATDIGPVIDKQAKQALLQHCERMEKMEKEEKTVKLIYECLLPQDLPELPKGVFFAPRLYQIKDISILEGEIFGPILHVVIYESKDLNNVIESINDTGYGLTLGIHSRISETIETIQKRVRIGNIYVNRNMIGAVVGVQPFGGEGLSGTGPKAGGPHMLQRLAVERTVSVNITAAGGNVSLMTLTE
ncbi:MAG: bifunctional proline dehydrogenase/L-glutamate gamma-semialdehyde dehydrogenase PutA [Gammaproteobacteria bacterium]|nr:bifunctional proline dehydrogenase/L-glutamate gamma-semialdehyde dehydrogenase PutA [Gammaproteobacteria bacterium]